MRHGLTPRLLLLIVGPLATFYALCWLIAIVHVRLEVKVTLPPEARLSPARATLLLETGAPQTIERAAPHATELRFDFREAIGSLRHFVERLEDPSVTIEVGKCKRLVLPISCGPWSIRPPNYLQLGSFGASFTRECSARGTITCPAR